MPDDSLIFDLVQPMADLMEPLSNDDRITLLMGLIVKEVCTLPMSERREALQDVLRDFPNILDAAEYEMEKRP
jgi:hypothetical protein